VCGRANIGHGKRHFGEFPGVMKSLKKLTPRYMYFLTINQYTDPVMNWINIQMTTYKHKWGTSKLKYTMCGDSLYAMQYTERFRSMRYCRRDHALGIRHEYWYPFDDKLFDMQKISSDDTLINTIIDYMENNKRVYNFIYSQLPQPIAEEILEYLF
jgi:hypothetical protein